MQPLQLTYNGVDLHDYGTVTVVSQASEFSPAEFPQKETRTLHVRIDVFAQDAGYNFDTLYAGIQSIRDAFQVQNGVLTWISPGESEAGSTQLNRPVLLVSHDLPEDPNAWGVFQQAIHCVFRYELDHSAASGALTATVLGTGTSPETVQLGQVHKWKVDYQSSFYSEWKHVPRRTSGVVTCSGEIMRGIGEGAGSTDTRLADVLSDLEELREQLQDGNEITLTYGPGGNIFNQAVRVDSFSAEMHETKTGVIRWGLTASYTRFPDEDGFAGAEFTTELIEDRDSGRNTLTLQGRILAATEALANGKLTSLTNAVLSVYGFAAANQTRREVGKNWVNADATQALEAEAGGEHSMAATQLLEMSFRLAYEKKASNVISYTLTIADSDVTETGYITKTYSGSVVASGANEAAAYAAALAKARELGDKKHPFRISANESRADRQLASQSSSEFMRLDFSYSYRTKGLRVYLQMNTRTVKDTFGEDSEHVSGFVVGPTLADARLQYQRLVYNYYAARLIRNESTEERQEKIQVGDPWYGTSGSTAILQGRLDFSFSCFKAKTSYAMKYGVRVARDYVALSQNTRLEGVFACSASEAAALEAGTSNALSVFLATISGGYGSLLSDEYSYDKERVGDGSTTTVSVRFSLAYSKKLTGESLLLRASLNEDLTYSGTRWVRQQTPDGASEIQNCGTTEAERTVSGSVTAATETAALDWVKKQHGTDGLWQNWRSAETPTAGTRYEDPPRISTRFEFVPLTADPLGRGADASFQVVTMDFTFREVIPDLSAPFSLVSP